MQSVAVSNGVIFVPTSAERTRSKLKRKNKNKHNARASFVKASQQKNVLHSSATEINHTEAPYEKRIEYMFQMMITTRSRDNLDKSCTSHIEYEKTMAKMKRTRQIHHN